MFPIEAVRPLPIVIDAVWGRYKDTGLEPGQLPDPVRERAQSGTSRSIECATANRPVAGPDVEDCVTVYSNVPAFGERVVLADQEVIAAPVCLSADGPAWRRTGHGCR